ncbi:MAG: glycosyltransferase family 4 protein [Anaerolineae bacterium]|nr:glycosyltransferase family 4 protein [Gemmatimonadaceae bacterium]
MRIAFIGGRGVASKYSGIETYYEAVGSELIGRGHQVTVYCRSYFTPKMEEFRGMRIVRIPTPRSKHFETVIHSLLSTMHALAARYDIVHYHALGPSLFVPIIRLFGGTAVVSVQGLDWRREKWGSVATTVLRICERTAVWFPQATIVVSRALQQHYIKAHHAVTHYVPNGIHATERREANAMRSWNLESRKYILFVGRFSPEKNCHLLIEAFRALDTDVKLVFAGDGPAHDPYVQRIKAAENERILFLGYVSGEPLQELLSNAAIFVLPSTIEGLSIALLEAMSYGNCVVTSDIPENRELVDDVGYTFENGNASDLARVLGTLLKDPAARAEAGARAKERVDAQYRWSEIAEQTENIYRSLASGTIVPKASTDNPVALPRT